MKKSKKCNIVRLEKELEDVTSQEQAGRLSAESKLASLEEIGLFLENGGKSCPGQGLNSVPKFRT